MGQPRICCVCVMLLSGQREWWLKLLSPAHLGLLYLCTHKILLHTSPYSLEHPLSWQCMQGWPGVHLSLRGTKKEHKHFGKSSVHALCVSKFVKLSLAPK